MSLKRLSSILTGLIIAIAVVVVALVVGHPGSSGQAGAGDSPTDAASSTSPDVASTGSAPHAIDLLSSLASHARSLPTHAKTGTYPSPPAG